MDEPSRLAVLISFSGAGGVERMVLNLIEGLAVRGNGRVVVSSPAGVLEVRLPTGSQDFRSGDFSSVGGLPVAPDSAGDLVVLVTGTGLRTTRHNAIVVHELA